MRRHDSAFTLNRAARIGRIVSVLGHAPLGISLSDLDPATANLLPGCPLHPVGGEENGVLLDGAVVLEPGRLAACPASRQATLVAAVSLAVEVANAHHEPAIALLPPALDEKQVQKTPTAAERAG